MFTLKIRYITGNSFGNHEEVDLIGFAWNNIEYCKNAMLSILEHNKYFNNKRFSRNISKNDIYEKCGEYSVLVKNDKGENVELDVFWRGYFESLEEVSIVVVNN